MRQQSLFAVLEIPEGLIFTSDFLTVQEERDLFALLQTLPFHEFKLHGFAAKRRVLHFGLRYALESRVLNTAPEIPSQFEAIRRRAAAFAGVAPNEFSQISPRRRRWVASRFARFWDCRGNLAWGNLHHALSRGQR